jgi:hypothetical protein
MTVSMSSISRSKFWTSRLIVQAAIGAASLCEFSLVIASIPTLFGPGSMPMVDRRRPHHKVHGAYGITVVLNLGDIGAKKLRL